MKEKNKNVYVINQSFSFDIRILHCGIERMKNHKISGAAGFLCAAVLFLGAGIFALGASAFNVLAAEVSGQITSCKITDDKQNVEIALNSSGSTEGTDGKVYVFEQPTYQDDLGSSYQWVDAHMGAGSVEAFSFDLNAEVVFTCHNAAGFSMQFSFWKKWCVMDAINLIPWVFLQNSVIDHSPEAFCWLFCSLEDTAYSFIELAAF